MGFIVQNQSIDLGAVQTRTVEQILVALFNDIGSSSITEQDKADIAEKSKTAILGAESYP